MLIRVSIVFGVGVVGFLGGSFRTLLVEEGTIDQLLTSGLRSGLFVAIAAAPIVFMMRFDEAQIVSQSTKSRILSPDQGSKELSSLWEKDEGPIRPIVIRTTFPGWLLQSHLAILGGLGWVGGSLIEMARSGTSSRQFWSLISGLIFVGLVFARASMTKLVIEPNLARIENFWRSHGISWNHVQKITWANYHVTRFMVPCIAFWVNSADSSGSSDKRNLRLVKAKASIMQPKSTRQDIASKLKLIAYSQQIAFDLSEKDLRFDLLSIRSAPDP